MFVSDDVSVGEWTCDRTIRLSSVSAVCVCAWNDTNARLFVRFIAANINLYWHWNHWRMCTCVKSQHMTSLFWFIATQTCPVCAGPNAICGKHTLKVVRIVSRMNAQPPRFNVRASEHHVVCEQYNTENGCRCWRQLPKIVSLTRETEEVEEKNQSINSIICR